MNKMEELKGNKISTFPYHLKKIGDLVWYDGPLMSVFKEENNCPWIFDWSDTDQVEYNRWLVFKTTTEHLKQYLDKEISHLRLIELSKELYSIDIKYENEITYHNIIKFKSFDDIPKCYLPNILCMYDAFSDESVELNKIMELVNIK